MIRSYWPHVDVYGHVIGELDPYDPSNLTSFRGEEAFSGLLSGIEKWSKPSPEPRFDDQFRDILHQTLERQGPLISSMIQNVATQIQEQSTHPPLLIAILRAGVPIAALLATQLGKTGETVPIIALSLFNGVGWDTQALKAAIKAHPNRDVWFIDGWTSGGGVAKSLKSSYQAWIDSGEPDFTRGRGPRLAVLSDPGGFATAQATHQDIFIASSCFTAPETLGFSRGFVREIDSLFEVYTYPERYHRPEIIEQWRAIARATPSGLTPEAVEAQAELPARNPHWRLHINEVVRALVNRSPSRAYFYDSEAFVAEHLSPVLYLCQQRQIPVEYDYQALSDWRAIAAVELPGLAA